MQFEVIRKSHKKSIVIGVSLLIILGVVLIARFTFAKYELVKSIKIAEGIISYKVPDFKIMAMYKNDGNGDEAIETMPESGYAINEEKSYCTLDNINKDTKAKLYTDLNGNHVISGLSKSDKCYIYFDNYKKVNTALGEIIVKLSTPDFSKAAKKTCSDETTCETTNGIYQARDDDGWSYYYRGDVENNYVKFAGFYWRIIRINGDGSIRLIYDGTSAHQNGELTEDNIAVKSVDFNEGKSDKANVGFKYTAGEIRGLETSSNALIELEKWYSANLSSYANKIDINAGFCGDRTTYIKQGESYILGIGNSMHYGSVIRTYINKSPSLKCFDVSDFYTASSSNKGNKSLTYPVALITLEEIALAGIAGYNVSANTSSYLYNGHIYWTMSPYGYNKNDSICNTGVSVVDMNGSSNSSRTGSIYNNSNAGLRPVINLRSDIKFTFTGTGEKGSMTNPYIVN